MQFEIKDLFEMINNEVICLLRQYSPIFVCTVCPGSSDPSKKIFNIFASENEVYTIF